MVAVPAAALALAEGCSSSSNPAAPQPEAGTPEASVEAAAAPDTGTAAVDAGNISLTWGMALVNSLTGPAGDGGPGPDAAPDSGGANDGGTTPDATSEGGAASDATVLANGADAGAEASSTAGYTAFYDGQDGGSPAVPGAQVCAYLYSAVANATPPPQSSALSCVTSVADGTFVIPNVPIRTNLVLIVTKTSFIPLVLSIQTASSPMDERANPIFMYPLSAEVNPLGGVTVDWTNKGQITVFAAGVDGDGGISGGSVSMNAQDDASPASGTGPVYQDSNFNFVPSATTFLPNGFVSTAYYFNVTAGLHTLTMMDTADDCEPGLMPFAPWGFPLACPSNDAGCVVTPAHSLQVLVLDGYIAGAVGFLCAPNSVIVSVDGG
jgi:hypothetical protein